MDLTGRTTLTEAPDRVAAVIADLATYPAWLGIVGRAEPTASTSDEAGPAWMVDLQAGIGPLRRTKRVRMVRVERTPRRVRFERGELDTAPHAAWVLTASLLPHGGGTELTMHLHYGGAPTLPLLDRVLGEEVKRAGRRLQALLDAPPEGGC